MWLLIIYRGAIETYKEGKQIHRNDDGFQYQVSRREGKSMDFPSLLHVRRIDAATVAETFCET